MGGLTHAPVAFRPKRHGGVNVVLGPKAVDNRCPEVSIDQKTRAARAQVLVRGPFNATTRPESTEAPSTLETMSTRGQLSTPEGWGWTSVGLTSSTRPRCCLLSISMRDLPLVGDDSGSRGGEHDRDPRLLRAGEAAGGSRSMGDTLTGLAQAGVSIWLDDLSRVRLSGWHLGRPRRRSGCGRGNPDPTIFAKAITDSEACDRQIHELGRRGVGVDEALRAVTAGCRSRSTLASATGCDWRRP
jgi:hypothetical protein